MNDTDNVSLAVSDEDGMEDININVEEYNDVYEESDDTVISAEENDL